MADKEKYPDKIILALRKKQQRNRWENKSMEELLESEKMEGFSRKYFGGQKFSLFLPEELQEMSESKQKIKYPNWNRPKLILSDRYGNATLAFSCLPLMREQKDKEVEDTLKEIQQEMKKRWKQQVFYETGVVKTGELKVAWLDYRGFCLDESLYSLLFLFFLQEEMILGNFHCSFVDYDRWKPIVLKLLETIETRREEKRQS
ncbi:MAG: hypothetical protein MR922_12430 [Lachnospiraceae bacterium]|nr:hypothetical protein [Lachnospiraceae bacterium]